MNEDKLFLISDLPGFSPHIGRLVSMMNYARHTTLRAVADLSIKELDCVPTGFGNSIAALLEHFAAVEVAYQLQTFEQRDLNETEFARWGAGLDLGERITEITGKPLEHYLTQLDTVRQVTLAEFAKRDDKWLHLEFPFWDGQPANNYFCWFHVFEDEINHRGQIRLIRQNLAK